MFRYTSGGEGARLASSCTTMTRNAIPYDRDFRLSPLAEALDRADDYGITVVSMKRDWKTVFKD